MSKKTSKQPDEIRRLAERIAAAMFVDGFGNKAERLQFMAKDDKPMGTGWGERGIANQIESILSAANVRIDAGELRPGRLVKSELEESENVITRLEMGAWIKDAEGTEAFAAFSELTPLPDDGEEEKR